MCGGRGERGEGGQYSRNGVGNSIAVKGSKKALGLVAKGETKSKLVYYTVTFSIEAIPLGL